MNAKLMKEAIIYYNPRCGTCRRAEEILLKKKYKLSIVEYLKKPPSVEDLAALLDKLKLEPKHLVRKKEPFYKEKLESKEFSRAEWLQILHEHPILIERPIVVLGNRAVVARPPEVLEEFLSTFC